MSSDVTVLCWWLLTLKSSVLRWQEKTEVWHFLLKFYQNVIKIKKLKIKKTPKQQTKKYSVKLPNGNFPSPWKTINYHTQSDKTKKTETWNGHCNSDQNQNFCGWQNSALMRVFGSLMTFYLCSFPVLLLLHTLCVWTSVYEVTQLRLTLNFVDIIKATRKNWFLQSSEWRT